jgi:PBP1b-binding outer membrane lipoprotein LpoB
MKTHFLVVATALLLAGCGQREALKPAEGHSLPPKPMMAPTQPTVVELLKPPVDSRPGRSDDSLTKSQERPDDRFNLPPPG